jgi:hypothetical protein
VLRLHFNLFVGDNQNSHRGKCASAGRVTKSTALATNAASPIWDSMMQFEPYPKRSCRILRLPRAERKEASL